ncbi:hypothetical protein LCGC14_1219540 [marine sediment metagenome]|uniref:HEAT repeat domain-containing protein n=1 Tax=marine sediment metagenome TaxID=412755 RepID=A0A0F9LZ27_9ZZZZ
MQFCSKHRLPENHECPFDLINPTDFDFTLSRDNIKYQDALDFMNNELTVAKIYEYVTTMKMNNLEASTLLIYILENSDDIEIRRNSVLAFKLLKLKNNNVFNALENCILTEDTPLVRNTAVDVIKHIFHKKSKEIIKWANNHYNDLND